MKKMIISISLCFICLLSSFKGVNAYELPSNYFYAYVYDHSLGPITLLFPSDKVSYLSLEEETQIINTGSTSITAYSNDLDYTITFGPFEYGKYRTSGTNYSYTYLKIEQIYETNIPFMSDSSFYVSSNYNQLIIGLSVLIFGGVVLLWLKR